MSIKWQKTLGALHSPNGSFLKRYCLLRAVNAVKCLLSFEMASAWNALVRSRVVNTLPVPNFSKLLEIRGRGQLIFRVTLLSARKSITNLSLPSPPAVGFFLYRKDWGGPLAVALLNDAPP